jgi:hypothetical protein
MNPPPYSAANARGLNSGIFPISLYCRVDHVHSTDSGGRQGAT